MKSESHSVMSYSVRSHGLYSPWNSPGQCTGVGSLSLLQGIFPTQGLNPGLLHCRQILYQRSHKGSPILIHYYYLNPQLELVLLFMLYSDVSCDKYGSHIHHYKPYRIVQVETIHTLNTHKHVHTYMHKHYAWPELISEQTCTVITVPKGHK